MNYPEMIDYGTTVERKLANTLPCAYPGCEKKASVCHTCEDRICPDGHMNLENMAKEDQQKECTRGNCAKKVQPSAEERQAMMSKMMVMMNDVFSNPKSEFSDVYVPPAPPTPPRPASPAVAPPPLPPPRTFWQNFKRLFCCYCRTV